MNPIKKKRNNDRGYRYPINRYYLNHGDNEFYKHYKYPLGMGTRTFMAPNVSIITSSNHFKIN